MTWHERSSITINGKSKAKKHVEASIKSQYSSTSRTPITESFHQYLSRMIQKAVLENSHRLSHGDTKYNAFWIDGERIIPYNEHKKVINSTNVISVHSHSGENKDNWNEQTDPLQPLNGGDLEGLQYMVKYGFGNTIALISAYGELEYIQFTPESDRSFVSMSRAKLLKSNELPLEYRTVDMYRKLMKSFCDHNKLKYVTGLRWK